jgi:type I restriction enzyme S subunit
LSQDCIVEKLHAIAEQSTSAYPSIKASDIGDIDVILPPIDVQRKIASILKIIDEKLAQNRTINRNLEHQASLLFKSWFLDFDCFSEPLVDSPMGYQIPESLKICQINDLPHTLETGKRPKGGAVSEGIPSIGAENVKELGSVNFSSAKYIPEEFASKMKIGKINGYELLLYKDGGKPGTFIPHFSMFGEGFPYDEFFINEHVFKLDFYNRGFNEFMYFYMLSPYPYNWLANNGGKAAVPGINQQDVNAIWTYSPENEKVKEFCDWIQPIFTTILQNCTQNVELTKIRDTLLPKLISGELDVSNIDI